MHRNSMAHRKLDAIAVDHLQRQALTQILIVFSAGIRIQRRTAAENIGYFAARFCSHNNFRLKYPCGIAILIWLHLPVDQKQSDQTIALIVGRSDGALNEHSWTASIWRNW
ncbi:hypothetical protein D3C71_1831910 [compost metagenome]